MPVQVGDRAPDFELPSRYVRDERRYDTLRLSDALGERPVLLQFFPSPFTGGCEAQMCAVRDQKDALYEAQGVTVWGVTGHYPILITLWAKEHHFGVPILADYEHTVSEAYVGFEPPELSAGLKWITNRGLVGISQDGVVRYVKVHPLPPTDEDVREAIEAVADREAARAAD